VRELIVREDRELRRLEQAIALFDHRSHGDRRRMHNLLSALIAARDEIQQSRHRRPICRPVSTLSKSTLPTGGWWASTQPPCQ